MRGRPSLAPIGSANGKLRYILTDSICVPISDFQEYSNDVQKVHVEFSRLSPHACVNIFNSFSLVEFYVLSLHVNNAT